FLLGQPCVLVPLQVSCSGCFFLLMQRRPPRATLFLYTTLFRSRSATTTHAPSAARRVAMALPIPDAAPVTNAMRPWCDFGKAIRSEEHTSELQSRENLVCRLLLEKKKQK